MSTPAADSAFGPDTRKLFEGCSGRVEIIRRIFDLENLCTPTETQALWELRDTLPPEAQPRIEKTHAMLHMCGKPPRAFKRTRLSPNVTLYTEPAQGESAKRLLICFCGNAGRMMMPTAVFLNHLPASRFDVVMLQDPSMNQYLLGVPDYAQSPEALGTRIASDFDFAQYRDVSLMGSSGGGAAALYFAVLLGATRGVSVSGGHPTRSLHQVPAASEEEGPDGFEFDELLRTRPDLPRRGLIAVYGEGFEFDRTGAETLREHIPQCVVAPVRDANEHTVLPALLKRRTLPAFLEQMLSYAGPTETR